VSTTPVPGALPANAPSPESCSFARRNDQTLAGKRFALLGLLLRGHRSWKLGVVALLTIAATGCGKNDPSTSQGVLAGWWVDPQAGGCFCPSQPECQAGDCVAYAVLGLRADGRYYDGQVAISRKNGTFSTAGTLSIGKWHRDGSNVIISQPNIPDAVLAVNVSGDQLTFGTRVEVRPSPSLSASLDQVTDDAGAKWTGRPLLL